MDSPTGVIGQTIGRYRVVGHLGRGGMAEVYKAYQANLDRYVALKLMHAFLAADQDFISRFEREAKNVAALRHPNIVAVYDYEVHNGTPYMVMEFIEGETLKTHLENLAHAGKPLPLSEALRIIHEVGTALSYAHQRQMIHRDVKPANVMLDSSGRIILTDFGIAKILTGPSYTVTGATIGTPAYMSPEQGLGRPGDHRSDLYALGVMLYQLATRQLPYEADTPLAVMLKHVNEPLPLPRTFQPDLPEGLERVILKAMAKNPDDRFQSADEMLAQLGNLDNANQLVIPPASMAAGPAAHANTVALTTGAQRSPAMADATRVAPRGAAGSGGAATAGVLPAAQDGDGAKAKSGRGWVMPVVVIIAILFIVGIVGGGAFAMTGGFGLLTTPTETVAPTRTETPTVPAPTASNTPPAPTATIDSSTATPNAVETQLASIQQTQAAIQADIATATPTNTPDMTATFAACTWDYAVAAQEPADNAQLPLRTNVTKTVALLNTGVCDFVPGSVLSETNLAANATPFTVTVPMAPPEATAEAHFAWPGLTSAGTSTRSFVFLGHNGVQIGEPMTFTLRYAAAATQRPPNTATPTTAPPTATQAAGGLTDIFPEAIIGCVYVGDGGMDYDCTAKVGYSGNGMGRMTLYVDGIQVGQGFQAGESKFYSIISRRCFPRTYNLRLIDDATLTQISRDFHFDPGGNAALFPGGGCTVP